MRFKMIVTLLAIVPMLSACDKTTSPAASTESIKPATTVETVVAPKTRQVVDLTGCEKPLLDQMSGENKFMVVSCPKQSGGVEYRFVHHDMQGDTMAVHFVDQASISAVVDNIARIFGGRILTLDLASERGGQLVIANWINGAFVISSASYSGGDEDSLDVTYVEGALVFSTESSGSTRLLEETTGEHKGQFKPVP